MIQLKLVSSLWTSVPHGSCIVLSASMYVCMLRTHGRQNVPDLSLPFIDNCVSDVYVCHLVISSFNLRSAVLTTGQTGHWPGPPSCWGPPTDATNFFTVYFLKIYIHFCQQKE